MGYISSLSVLKPYQRKGIASNLLSLLIEHAFINGIRKLDLKVFKNNIPAIKLYEKNGFYKIKERIKDGFILMTKYLPEF